MTTPNIAFVDTETTSLKRGKRIWEVAIILRRHRQVGTPAFEDSEHHYIIEDVNLYNADIKSLEIGGFFERHKRVGHSRGYTEAVFAEEAFRMLHEATIVGNVPNFDTDGFEAMFCRHNLIPTWHYHLLDVENLIVGYIRGLQHAIEESGGWTEDSPLTEQYDHIQLYDCQPPWNSEELSRIIGINPNNYERHTAMGDARWVRDSYNMVMGIK